MLLPIDEFLFASVADQIVVSHLDKKIRFDVVEPDKIGSKFKSALEKEGMLKDIKGADYIVRFAEKIEAQPPADGESPEDSEEAPEESPEDNSEETDSKEETPEENPEEDPEEDSKEEETTEEPEEDAEEDSEEDSADEDSTGSEDDSEEDDKKKDKKEVNESMKVQDLTKSMLLPVKGQSGKSASPKTSKSTSAKSSPKKCTGKDGKCTKCERECAEKNTGKKSGKIQEAETQATGDELKIKVQKTVAKAFDMDKDKVELVDVPDCIDGYNVYYFKITFKDHEGQTEEED